MSVLGDLSPDQFLAKRLIDVALELPTHLI